MTVTANRWRCNTCETPFQYDGDPQNATCPSCGSPYLTRYIDVQDELRVSVSEHVSLRAKDPRQPSKKKLRRELRSGRRLEGSGSGRLVEEHRLIDRDRQLYQERIVDVASGIVLRDVEHSLPTHRGGSEKRKRRKT